MDPAAAPRSMFTVITMLPAPRTGLLARRAKPYECAWIRVVREAVGPEGQVVPQQWLVRTPAPGVDPDDRRRLDFVAYGATQLGEALCCDVTLLPPLTPDGSPQLSSSTRDGAALAIAERRKRAAYPEFLRRGPQRLCVLTCRDRRALERRVAPPRRAARPFACPASPCSAPRSCRPGLVQTPVGPNKFAQPVECPNFFSHVKPCAPPTRRAARVPSSLGKEREGERQRERERAREGGREGTQIVLPLAKSRHTTANSPK